jgi:hypothetical protein
VDQDIDPLVLHRRSEHRNLRRIAGLQRMQDDVTG